MRKPNNDMNSSFRIPDNIEARLIELSLQYPEFGATRLLGLLKQEVDDIAISPSSVYNILKRHGLQNREKRSARAKVKRVVEELKLQSEKISLSSPDRFDENSPHYLPVMKVPKRMIVRSSWGLTAFNIVLLILLLLSGLYTSQYIRNLIQEEPPIPIEIQSKAKHTPALVQVASLPNEDYSHVWERNLFDFSQEEALSPAKEYSNEELTLVKTDLGLRLIGTVVSDDSTLNRALIDNLKNRSQGIYIVGDKIGRVLIKEIMNDRIIIDTGRGDEILLLMHPMITVTQLPDDIQTITQEFDPGPPTKTIKKNGPRHRTITLSRSAVETALADIDQSLDNVYISPGKIFNRQKGFRIASFERDTIFSQLGLRNNDLILSIDDQRIKSPDEAKAFFEKIRDGGDLEVRVRRRARTITLHMTIE
jgi:general secretion pathway protein C